MNAWEAPHDGQSLPIWASVEDSYRLFWLHWKSLLRATWIPVIIIIAGSGASTLGETTEFKMPAARAISILGGLVGLLFLCAAQVRWYRVLLLGEATPPGRPLGRRDLVYLGYLLLLVFLPWLPAALGVVVLKVFHAKAATLAGGFGLFGFFGFLVGLWAMARLSMTGPLVATDRSDRPLRGSWSGTRGYALELFAIPLLVMLLTIPVDLAVAVLRRLNLTLGALAGVPLNIGVYALLTTCLAVMFARLSGRPLSVAG
jgi:hypothetical protein